MLPFYFLFTFFSITVYGFPNILHIIVDDLSVQYKGPNMERLSKSGVTYTNAFSNFPVCSPSRSSFMTGLYPDQIKVYSFIEKVDNEITIPLFLKNTLGYRTASFGKVFHWPKDGSIDIYKSHWSYQTKTYGSAQAYFPDANSRCKKQLIGCFVEEEDTVDHIVVNQALEYLKAYNQKDPWYVAIGFYRPHLNNAIPKDKFKRANIKLIAKTQVNATLLTSRTSLNYFECDDLAAKQIYSPTTGLITPVVTSKNKNRENSCAFTLNYPLDVDKITKFYIGAVYHIDSELGRILDFLDRSPSIKANTLIIFHSDHGWSNGEHCLWCKNTLYDISSKVPLIIKYPSEQNLPDTTFHSYVQLVDIFPTILDVLGTKFINNYKLPGKSLLSAKESNSHFAITQYPRCKSKGDIQDNNCMFSNIEPLCDTYLPPLYMGYAYRNGDGSIFLWKSFKYKMKTCAKLYSKSIQAVPIIDKENSETLWFQKSIDSTLFNKEGIEIKDNKLQEKLETLLLETIK